MNLKTEQLNNTILKEFIFDLNNIQSLTNKEFLKILGLKTFLLKFNLEKRDFLNHFIKNGFLLNIDNKNKSRLYTSLEIFELSYLNKNELIKIRYKITKNDYIHIYYIQTENYILIFNLDGSLKSKLTNKIIANNLHEKSYEVFYVTNLINSSELKFISNIQYNYDDYRTPFFKNYILNSIIEYPKYINNENYSLFEPIYFNQKTEDTLNLSSLISKITFNTSILKGKNEEHRFELIDFSLFSKSEIKLLNLLLY
jgi:hypothetical protein